MSLLPELADRLSRPGLADIGVGGAGLPSGVGLVDQPGRVVREPTGEGVVSPGITEFGDDGAGESHGARTGRPPRTRPDAVPADAGKAYPSRASRVCLRRRGLKAVIPEKADQAANRKKRGRDGGRPVAHDAEQYKERNMVERCISTIRTWRGLATRYDKTPASYVGGLQLCGSIIWMRSLNLGPRPRTSDQEAACNRQGNVTQVASCLPWA